MNVNNFDQIKELLIFDSDDDFYFIEILQRKKENPRIHGYSNSIKMYFIRSILQYESLQDQIIKLCQIFNARAYITLNRRSFKQIAHKMPMLLSKHLELGNYSQFQSLYKSCCSTWSKEPKKKWILDFDDYKITDDILVNIKQFLTKCRPVGDKFITLLPTVNGFHVIVKPFDINQFNIKCEIHKDRLTLLYYENMECEYYC